MPVSRPPRAAQTAPATFQDAAPTEVLESLERAVEEITSEDAVPEELAVLEVLDRAHQFANVVVFGTSETPSEEALAKPQEDTAASLLRDLEEPQSTSKVDLPKVPGLSLSFRGKAANTICELLYTLLKDPKIFISLPILEVYTRIQCLLGRPEYLPEIFYLYAHKPIPRAKSSPIQYSSPSPKSPKSAIPLRLSDAALEAAIQKKKMALAIAIIDTTVGTSAFRRDKLLRRASLPFMFVASTPVIAYAGAEWVSKWQNVWDPSMSKWTAMAGAMAYITTLSTIGFVAVTTWNDHHDRVAWTPGTSLRERWTREEERAYYDRVAIAWGFKEKLKRGEEQGEEWESLRETVALRSMMLDAPHLMEGME